MAILAAALVAQAQALAESATGDPRAALVAWAAALGPPVAFYAFHLYTEVPSGLAAALALRLLLEAPGSSVAGAGAALLASTLPWLHVKMAPAAVALGVVALVRLRGRPLVAFVATAAAAAAVYLGYYATVFGRPTPLAVYGGVPRDLDASPLVAALGLLLDRSFGLLPVAPVFVLAIAGAAGVAARLRTLWPHALVGASILGPVLGWRMWWGGQCPPARFLVPLVPLLALGVALRLASSPRGLARWRWPLAALGFGLALFMAAEPDAMLMLNRRDRPTRVWDALSGETQVGRYLPSLVSAEPEERRVAAVWAGAAALLLVLDVAAQRKEAADRLFRGLGMPLALLLAIGLMVDYWAR
jgi:hypothetical protein